MTTTTFPTTIDAARTTLVTGANGTKTDAGAHADRHNLADGQILALQAKIGKLYQSGNGCIEGRLESRHAGWLYRQ